MFKSKIKSFWAVVTLSVISAGMSLNSNADTMIPFYITNNTGSDLEIAYQFCTPDYTCEDPIIYRLKAATTQINLPSSFPILNVPAAAMRNNGKIQGDWENQPYECSTGNQYISISYDKKKSGLICLISN